MGGYLNDPLSLLFLCENQLVIFNEDTAVVPGGYG